MSYSYIPLRRECNYDVTSVTASNHFGHVHPSTGPVNIPPSYPQMLILSPTTDETIIPMSFSNSNGNSPNYMMAYPQQGQGQAMDDHLYDFPSGVDDEIVIQASRTPPPLSATTTTTTDYYETNGQHNLILPSFVGDDSNSSSNPNANPGAGDGTTTDDISDLLFPESECTDLMLGEEIVPFCDPMISDNVLIDLDIPTIYGNTTSLSSGQMSTIGNVPIPDPTLRSTKTINSITSDYQFYNNTGEMSCVGEREEGNGLIYCGANTQLRRSATKLQQSDADLNPMTNFQCISNNETRDSFFKTLLRGIYDTAQQIKSKTGVETNFTFIYNGKIYTKLNSLELLQKFKIDYTENSLALCTNNNKRRRRSAEENGTGKLNGRGIYSEEEDELSETELDQAVGNGNSNGNGIGSGGGGEGGGDHLYAAKLLTQKVYSPTIHDHQYDDSCSNSPNKAKGKLTKIADNNNSRKAILVNGGHLSADQGNSATTTEETRGTIAPPPVPNSESRIDNYSRLVTFNRLVRELFQKVESIEAKAKAIVVNCDVNYKNKDYEITITKQHYQQILPKLLQTARIDVNVNNQVQVMQDTNKQPTTNALSSPMQTPAWPWRQSQTRQESQGSTFTMLKQTKNKKTTTDTPPVAASKQTRNRNNSSGNASASGGSKPRAKCDVGRRFKKNGEIDRRCTVANANYSVSPKEETQITVVQVEDEQPSSGCGEGTAAGDRERNITVHFKLPPATAFVPVPMTTTTTPSALASLATALVPMSMPLTPPSPVSPPAAGSPQDQTTLFALPGPDPTEPEEVINDTDTLNACSVVQCGGRLPPPPPLQPAPLHFPPLYLPGVISSPTVAASASASSSSADAASTNNNNNNNRYSFAMAIQNGPICGKCHQQIPPLINQSSRSTTKWIWLRCNNPLCFYMLHSICYGFNCNAIDLNQFTFPPFFCEQHNSY